MTSVLMTECGGLWRRTLLIDSDGSHDTSTGVAWLQGITAYVDTRGFAGRLSQHGDVFEWQRLINIGPPGPFPDAGRMRWESGALVEVGVHEDYVEHWVRQDGPVAPCWALFAENAILLRAGAQFGWADRSGVVVDTIGGPRWTALNPHVNGGDLVANGPWDGALRIAKEMWIYEWRNVIHIGADRRHQRAALAGPGRARASGRRDR